MPRYKYPFTLSHRHNLSLALKASYKRGRRVFTPFKGKHIPESVKFKISQTKKIMCNTPKNKKATSDFFKEYYKDPKHRQEAREKTLAFFKNNPAARKLWSERTKLQFSNIENRKLLSDKLKERYRNHPYLRRIESERKQRYYENNPAALKRLLSYSKRSMKRSIKTRQGWLVRSNGEKKIAEFLWDNKINALYEAIELNLPQMDPVPDFYLPKLHVFIEFYGGHPKSWKSKVEKNKLYSKYKIPVIGITPAELNDLDYYLLSDAKELGMKEIARKFKLSRWQLGDK
ncbi:MAG: hypothetical protein V1660_00080 [archaeon]